MRTLCLLLGLSYLLTAPDVTASGEFFSKHDVTYTFDSQGVSTVDQRVTLTNKLSGIYASEYVLTLQGSPPQNISGHDSSGPLRITTSTAGDTTNVKLAFNDQIVGQDKSLNFSLTYHSQPATHNGQVWEVILPRLGNPDQIDDYQLTLVVPPVFGKLAFVSPTPASSSAHQYTFTKDQIGKIGVVASFGNFQTFGFRLTYNLQNSTSRPGLTTIALPADTNYQRVFYDSLDPAPQSVEVDPDGNWLATYQVSPRSQLDVVAAGQAHILAEPTRTLVDATSATSPVYLQATPYWPSADPFIKQLAAKLRTPEAIYNYVVSTLSYDYARAKPGVARKGGLAALNTPQSSICTEFTDAFITLARAAGIPAREVNGYAYTTDSNLRPLSLVSDVLHAWPQYWSPDRQTWISIDPTWGKTTGGIDYFHKLDFNHFTFVTHGQSDSQPLPAGSYKQDPSSRQVEVFFDQYQDYPVPQLDLSWRQPWQILPFITSSSTLTIKNPSGQALYHLPVDIIPSRVRLVSPVTLTIPVLPPYGQVSLPLVFAPHTTPDFSPKSLFISVGNQQITYNVPAQLFLGWQITLGILAALITTVMGFIAHKAWSVYLQKRLRSDSLRR